MRRCYNVRRTKVNPLELFVSSLPAAVVLPELLAALKYAPQVLLNAPTGAGKSTWLPLQILTSGVIPGKIILLEPRRLAARNVAQRLAELLNEKPGETVGYRMRADTCVGPTTRLEVVTEGILTRMLQNDPELNGVGLVILDEFHERSLQADLALALLLDVQQGLRDDLRLLIMSATLDNALLRQALPDAPVISSEGRAFPVERRYQSLPAHQRFDDAVAIATAELLRQEPGSLLLFLPGVGEIQRVQEQLATRVGGDVMLCPLYGALPLSEQRKAILPAPAGQRKVVLATNIAETSLTIEGIRLVVDCAQERVASFDPRTGLTRLITQRISQASMVQRAGRAGRLEPGICLHLIRRRAGRTGGAARYAGNSAKRPFGADDGSASVGLSGSGAAGLAQPAAGGQSCRCPYTAGPARCAGRRTAVVRAGGKWRPSATIRVWRPCWWRQREMTKLPRPRNWRLSLRSRREVAAAIWRRLFPVVRGTGSSARSSCADGSTATVARPTGDRIVPLLARAFPDRIARRRGLDGRYQLANGMGAMLEVDDALTRHEWLIAPLLLQGSHSPDARILQAIAVDIDALTRACPQLLQQSDSVEWDEAQGTLKGVSPQPDWQADAGDETAGEALGRGAASGDAERHP
ncbi:ATP-dependent RNA helicase hrpB [Enterobacter cancerogenus]|uniref:ATP-dependent RNA helicase hrpB n=1 Tax=Enterobacter cancerogenus TaxID=69218 RepID=A0A484WS08_9ENTR|nr:ATP-dependent RNA helicase hrpB [Enterobacter cancerogenus]